MKEGRGGLEAGVQAEEEEMKAEQGGLEVPDGRKEVRRQSVGLLTESSAKNK